MTASDGYFKYLYTLENDDNITYQTALGERTYTVESITTIAASDWTPLGYTDDNRLTKASRLSYTTPPSPDCSYGKSTS